MRRLHRADKLSSRRLDHSKKDSSEQLRAARGRAPYTHYASDLPPAAREAWLQLGDGATGPTKTESSEGHDRVPQALANPSKRPRAAMPAFDASYRSHRLQLRDMDPRCTAHCTSTLLRTGYGCHLRPENTDSLYTKHFKPDGAARGVQQGVIGAGCPAVPYSQRSLDSSSQVSSKISNQAFYAVQRFAGQW